MAPIDVKDSAGNVIWHKEDGYPNPNRADIDPKYKVTSIANLLNYDLYLDNGGSTCWCGWNIKTADLSKFDTTGITNISDLFGFECGCGGLDLIDLSFLDTSKVIEHEFECKETNAQSFKKGYAKTQLDADNLIDWTGIPFEVKNK